MKKRILFGLLALATVLFVTTPASAILVPTDEFLAHLTDASALYWDHDEDAATPMIPRAPQDIQLPGAPVVAPWADTSPAIGDENRAIIDVTQFTVGGQPFLNLSGGTLTGLLYDLELVAIVPDPGGAPVFDLYFAPLGRNPLADAPVGPAGGVLELWLDPTPEGADLALYDPFGDGLAPFHWAEGGGPGGRDAYPTVNLGDDSTLWLSAELAPLGMVDTDGDGVPDTIYVLRERINGGPFLLPGNPDGQSGEIVGLGFLDIVGGSDAWQFARDVFGPGLDLSVDSNFLLPLHPSYGAAWDAGNWPIESSDPIRGEGVIPEPATMVLFGLSLLGLGARIRRRKQSP